MKKIVSYISNGQYSIGCTGQTVYVYDQENKELAKFIDMKYAYLPVISPRGDIFAVKSTVGRLAIYSLKELCLIKKFRFSKLDGAQDDNFCFSFDGTRLYNLEMSEYVEPDGYNWCISIYDTKDFSLVKRLFLEDKNIDFHHIEYSAEEKAYFLLGRINHKCCVARLVDDELKEVVYIDEKTYKFYHGFKNLEGFGFTDTAKRWSSLRNGGYDLNGIEEQRYPLAKLWKDKIN